MFNTVHIRRADVLKKIDIIMYIGELFKKGNNHKIIDLGKIILVQQQIFQLPHGTFRFGIDARSSRTIENFSVFRQVHHETVDSIF